MPKVSIIVPIYNVEEYLSECLKSIISQTLKDIEIICVNDGSTDRSSSILEDYSLKDARIKVVNKNNTGYGNSMNIGLSKATGDYIGIVESDDFIECEMFEKLYYEAEKNKAEVVKANYFNYRNKVSTFVENLKKCKYNIVFSPMNEEKVFFVDPSIWSAIYKKDFLENNNIVFNETPGASYQDTSFAFKIWASAKRVYLLEDAYLHYRNDNVNSSVNSSSKIFCVCDEYDEIKRFLKNSEDKEKSFLALTVALKFITYRWNYNRLASSFQYAFLIRMAEEFKKDEKKGYIQEKYFDSASMNEIHKIINNTDDYFTNTSKDYTNNKIFANSILNLKIYKHAFIENIKKYENVIIYGAGAVGKRVYKNLINKEKISNILCFAVSNKIKNVDMLYGMEVNSIYNLSIYKDNSVILVATKERDQYEIVKLLKALNYKNIIAIDSNLFSTLD